MSTLKFLLDADDVVHNLHPDLNRFAMYLDTLEYQVNTLDLEQLQKVSAVEQEHFLGQYRSPADFAKESLSNAYGDEIDALPSIIRNGIDWAEIWNSEYRHDCFDAEIYDDGEFWTLIWHAH